MSGRSAAVDQLERALEFSGRALQSGRNSVSLDGGIPVELARRLLRVFGDVDVDGARASRRGNLERLAERSARCRLPASPG
jgi:hypothetical protein